MYKLFLVATLKELLKSANICQSYSRNKRGSFFTHSVVKYTLRRHYYCSFHQPYDWMVVHSQFHTAHLLLCFCSSFVESESHSNSKLSHTTGQIVQCYAWTEYKFTCVCVCLSVCPSHFLSTRLQVRPFNLNSNPLTP